MMKELAGLDALLNRAREQGNAFVASGEHRKALSVYSEGLTAIKKEQARIALQDGTNASFEPVPLVLNGAFCSSSVVFTDCKKAMKVTEGNYHPTIDQKIAAELHSLHEGTLHRYDDELGRLERGYAALQNTKTDDTAHTTTATNSDGRKRESSALLTAVIPPRYQTQELRAKVYFRRAQVKAALSNLASLKGLALPPANANMGIAAAPIRFAIESLEYFRKCQQLEGVVETCEDFHYVRRTLFAYCSYTHPSLDKASSSVHRIGMFVRSDIKAGTLLLVERPAVLVPSSKGNYEQRFIAAIETILEWQQSELGSRRHQLLLGYLALHGDPTVDNDDEAAHADENATISPDLLCDVWLRNSMRLSNVDFSLNERRPQSQETKALQGGAALYLDASRFNHSCFPNAVSYFDLKSLPRPSAGFNVAAEVNVVAIRDMKAGEEVFISYTGLISSKQKKKTHLKFSCKCAICHDIDNGGAPSKVAQSMEAVICPVCNAETTACVSGHEVTATPTPPETRQQDQQLQKDGNDELVLPCSVCRHSLPVEQYLSTVQSKIDTTVDSINEAGTPEEAIKARLDGATTLARMATTTAKFLGPLHYLRVQTGLEALSCAAAVPGTQIGMELRGQLVELCQQLIFACEKVCPPNWPLTTGIQMHLVYLLASGHHATISEKEKEGGGSSTSAPDSVIKSLLSGEAGDVLCAAFASHSVLHPAVVGPVVEDINPNAKKADAHKKEQQHRTEDGVIELDSPDGDGDEGHSHRIRNPDANVVDTFLARYVDELGSCGIHNLQEFDAYF